MTPVTPGTLQRLAYHARNLGWAGRSLWRHLRSRRSAEIGLGAFEASSPRVAPGQPQRYAIRIANARPETCDITLRVDVFEAGPRRPAAHHAGVAKRLAIGPRGLCCVEIVDDWRTTPQLIVDGAACSPDAAWRGETSLPSRCSVHAVLYDERDREVDRLALEQEIAG